MMSDFIVEKQFELEFEWSELERVCRVISENSQPTY